jgi:sugar phosphate isomerase/epimerase
VGDERSLTTQLTVAILKEALERTPQTKAAVFLEPLNRYETWYLRTIGHAAELCEAVGSPRVSVMADLFHMSIEEAQPTDSLRDIQDHVGHVHLADSNRLLPGQGHSDFVAPFHVLQASGFAGWMALECGLGGEADEVLPKAVEYITQCWAQAQQS